ncbi:hypothetical protein LFM09_46140 [Lentzea alba]
MSGRIVWPVHRTARSHNQLAGLRCRPEVRVRALALLARWAKPGTGRDELTIMMANAVELTALRTLLDHTR